MITIPLESAYLLGLGYLGNYIYFYDWSNTSLGTIHSWPEELKFSLNLILSSSHPMFIIWGENRNFFYNLAFAHTLGITDHSTHLGRSFREVYPEHWGECEPVFKKIYKGASLHIKNLKMILNRHAYIEEAYYNFSCNPIKGKNQVVDGFIGFMVDIAASYINETHQTSTEIDDPHDNARRRVVDENLLCESIRIRDEIISIASHELKTPVAIIKMHLQMLSNKLNSVNLPDLSNNILLCLEQVDKINYLINDLFDLTKIQCSSLDLNLNKVNLKELTNQAIQLHSQQVKDNDIAVHINIPDNCFGMWDSMRIEQVITNFITNAIKYAPGKPLEISATTKNDWVKIIVRDFGPGIPFEKQKYIFNRFERATPSDETDGLGLGLFIVKNIILSHQGKIRVKSKLGQGTSFIIHLPLDSTSSTSAARIP